MTILKRVLGWAVDLASSMATIIALPVAMLIVLVGYIVKPMRQVFIDLATLVFIIPAVLDALGESLRHNSNFILSYNKLMDDITDRICERYQ